jgi:NAD(P) transhydrogenase
LNGIRTECFDIAVIGSGPAGQKAAMYAAKHGKKVVIIDRRSFKVGGVSLHTGTIPSKTLREAVLYLTGIRHRHIYGEDYSVRKKITLPDLLKRVDAIITHELTVLEAQFAGLGVSVIYGQAEFIDNANIKVTDFDGNVIAKINAKKTIIATGTVPRHPEDINFDYEVIFDSNFIFSSKSKLKELPDSLIVLGGGVIGCEYAAMFAALGCEVTLIDKNKKILSYLDDEINSYLLQQMIDMNVELLFGDNYKSIVKTNEGRGKVELTSGKVVEADAVLFAMGRTPCTEPLHLENTDVQFGGRGVIKVDENYKAGDTIYACGDVIGFPALASTSAEQGRVTARNAMGLDVSCHKPELFPFAIYTIPELSMIGKTEQELKQSGINYETGIAYYYQIAKATIKAGSSGMLKILFNKNTYEILGVHVIGDQAAEIIHIGQTVMSLKGNLNYFVENVFNYPTWAEAYKVAAINGMEKMHVPYHG